MKCKLEYCFYYKAKQMRCTAATHIKDVCVTTNRRVEALSLNETQMLLMCVRAMKV